MTGPDLVDRMFQPPASHRYDPETSHAAERVANIKGQALELYEALKRHGPATMRELSAITGVDYYTYQRRCSVLERNHLAIRCGTRTNPQTGQENQIWRAK